MDRCQVPVEDWHTPGHVFREVGLYPDDKLQTRWPCPSGVSGEEGLPQNRALEP